MIQIMMTAIGAPAVHGAQHRQTLMWRKTLGFAIVTSGFAVIVAQVLQHTLGG